MENDNHSIGRNPFDFANPVRNSNLFAGRDEEMNDIKYYLEYSLHATHPINLALLGPRASGKTSMLNIAEQEATRLGLCAVRINLDEDDASSQLSFFFKLFDALLSTACEQDAFGGTSGRTYDTYLEMISTYTVPEDKTFCPFIFPMQYARAKASGNDDMQVSDHVLKRDLEKIHSALEKHAVLLIDEGNVLTKSRPLLQKLRNLFMNLSGYMLIISGTEDLFQAIDDVFSPIIRQFKKINVGEFKRNSDTEECIKKHLLACNHSFDELFGDDAFRTIREVHNLSGGRPYDIQLVCHHMFRRIEDGQAQMMHLNFAVIEDVRRSLETSQDISKRPIITHIRNMSKEELKALAILCRNDGRVTFDQLWTLCEIFDRYNTERISPWTRDALHDYYQRFIEQGVIGLHDNFIRFAGDDFDKIYARYFAREQDIRLYMGALPIDIEVSSLFYSGLLDYLSNNRSDDTAEDAVALLDRSPMSSEELASILGQLADSSSSEDVLSSYPFAADLAYRHAMNSPARESICVVEVKLDIGWTSMRDCYVIDPTCIGRVEQYLEELKHSVTNIGGEVTSEHRLISNVPPEILIEKAKATSNKRIRSELAGIHANKAVDGYLAGEVDVALEHIRLALFFDPPLAPQTAVNLGYMLLATGNLEEAEALLKAAVPENILPITLIKQSRSPLPLYRVVMDDDDDVAPTRALALFDLGILESKRGNFDAAKICIESCLQQLAPDKDNECLRLLCPTLISGGMTLLEQKDIQLRKAATEALDMFQRIVVENIQSVPNAAKSTRRRK